MRYAGQLGENGNRCTCQKQKDEGNSYRRQQRTHSKPTAHNNNCCKNDDDVPLIATQNAINNNGKSLITSKMNINQRA